MSVERELSLILVEFAAPLIVDVDIDNWLLEDDAEFASLVEFGSSVSLAFVDFNVLSKLLRWFFEFSNVWKSKILQDMC